MDCALEKIVSPYRGRKGAVVPVLQEIQAKEGYISREAVEVMSRELGISENEIYGVATFYAQFRFEKPGRHTLKVCLGTACHVRGGQILCEAVERELGVVPGQTTDDERFDLQRVACLGCCALAPVLQIADDIHARMNVTRLKAVLARYE